MQQEGKKGNWINPKDRLPGVNNIVEWRNGAGGNIPLGKRTFLDHYAKCGPNACWHEWLEVSTPSPVSGTLEVIDEKIKWWENQIGILGSSDWHDKDSMDKTISDLKDIKEYAQQFHPQQISKEQAASPVKDEWVSVEELNKLVDDIEKVREDSIMKIAYDICLLKLKQVISRQPLPTPPTK